MTKDQTDSIADKVSVLYMSDLSSPALIIDPGVQTEIIPESRASSP